MDWSWTVSITCPLTSLNSSGLLDSENEFPPDKRVGPSHICNSEVSSHPAWWLVLSPTSSLGVLLPLQVTVPHLSMTSIHTCSQFSGLGFIPEML